MKNIYNQILNFINQKDKIYHICANIILILIGNIINVVFGVVLAILASLGKEIYDMKNSSGFSKQDLVADLIGIIIGILLVL